MTNKTKKKGAAAFTDQILNPAEAKRLFKVLGGLAYKAKAKDDAVGVRNAFMLYTMLLTGASAEDLADMRIGHVKLRTGMLTIDPYQGANVLDPRRRRTIGIGVKLTPPLPPLTELLSDWLSWKRDFGEPRGIAAPLFCSKFDKGVPVSPSSYYGFWKKLRKRANLRKDLPLRCLRNWFIRTSYMNGSDVAMLSATVALPPEDIREIVSDLKRPLLEDVSPRRVPKKKKGTKRPAKPEKTYKRKPRPEKVRGSAADAPPPFHVGQAAFDVLCKRVNKLEAGFKELERDDAGCCHKSAASEPGTGGKSFVSQLSFAIDGDKVQYRWTPSDGKIPIADLVECLDQIEQGAMGLQAFATEVTRHQDATRFCDEATGLIKAVAAVRSRYAHAIRHHHEYHDRPLADQKPGGER
jgi:hypothetical protein